MSVDESSGDPTADDVVRSIRDNLRLEEEQKTQLQRRSRFSRLTDEIARRRHRPSGSTENSPSDPAQGQRRTDGSRTTSP